jgi:hypothetical protein
MRVHDPVDGSSMSKAVPVPALSSPSTNPFLEPGALVAMGGAVESPHGALSVLVACMMWCVECRGTLRVCACVGSPVSHVQMRTPHFVCKCGLPWLARYPPCSYAHALSLLSLDVHSNSR